MAESEYSTNNYNSLKISVGATIKNPEIIRFIPDHIKTKTVYKNAAKKLLFTIRYVPY